jgi:hypothetical protein
LNGKDLFPCPQIIVVCCVDTILREILTGLICTASLHGLIHRYFDAHYIASLHSLLRGRYKFFSGGIKRLEDVSREWCHDDLLFCVILLLVHVVF